MAKIRFPEVECKWGDAGLDEIIEDASIVAVVVVLAAQFQACIYIQSLLLNYVNLCVLALF